MSKSFAKVKCMMAANGINLPDSSSSWIDLTVASVQKIQRGHLGGHHRRCSQKMFHPVHKN